MKGSAQRLFSNLCGCTHGSERDFSFNSRTSGISRYLRVLCRLDCCIPVCCWQALFYSSHWQVKVTLQGAVPLFLQGWCCFLCQLIRFSFFPSGKCNTDRCRHLWGTVMQKKKATLNFSLLTPPFVNWPALTSDFCVNLSNHLPPSLSEKPYFMASYTSDTIYLSTYLAIRKDKPAGSDSWFAVCIPFCCLNLLVWIMLSSYLVWAEKPYVISVSSELWFLPGQIRLKEFLSCSNINSYIWRKWITSLVTEVWHYQ